ncbi:MAG: hypothetical protein CMM45_00780 [Rhodospirillaceae bacterium]|nr:hypothetical protein [Rhodospirillaceae bacterium]
MNTLAGDQVIVHLTECSTGVGQDIAGWKPRGQFQPMREYRMAYWDTTLIDRDLQQGVAKAPVA